MNHLNQVNTYFYRSKKNTWTKNVGDHFYAFIHLPSKLINGSAFLAALSAFFVLSGTESLYFSAVKKLKCNL